MRDKQIIWDLFDALRPIIIANLLNPEVPVSARGQTFFYDGIDSTEGSSTVDVAQLVVPLNDEKFCLLTNILQHIRLNTTMCGMYILIRISLFHGMAGSNILFSPSKKTTDKTICFALASCAMEITM